MHVVKPFRLGLISRVFEHAQKCRFSVAILVCTPLKDSRKIIQEYLMWKAIAPVLGQDGVLDEGMPKARAEFLLKGTAYAPGGTPTRVFPVRVKVGEVDKRVVVVGDRFWLDRGPTEAIPITSMPLEWQRAFGGEGYKKNPSGKGISPIKTPHGEVVPLPNLELHRALVRGRADRPPPAGFGPIDITWEPRSLKPGTYDTNWLNTDFPGLARDIDWSMFNVAPEDQWFPEYLPRGTSFELDGLHAEHPHIEGTIPDLQTRCFIRRRATGDALEELPTHIDTVWFFPEIDRMVTIHRAVTDCLEDDADDITTLLLAGEDPRFQRPLDFYESHLRLRTDPKEGAKIAMKDDGLMPGWAAGHVLADERDATMMVPQLFAKQRAEQFQKQQILESRAVVAAAGLDPDEHAAAVPASLGPKEIEAAAEQDPNETLEKELAELRVKLDMSLAGTRKLLGEHGVDPGLIDKEVNDAPRGPPTFSADKLLAEVREIGDQAAKRGTTLPDIDEMLKDPTWYERNRALEEQLRDLYRLGAHMQEPADPMSRENSESARKWVEELKSRGESLENVDLTGADLSGMDLRGMNFQGSLMEKCNLTDADLSGANMTAVVLAHANLTRTNFTGAFLAKANLGRAHLEETNFTDARLRSAMLMRANLKKTRFVNAVLTLSTMLEAKLEDVDFSRTELTKLFFYKMTFDGCRFEGADLDSANFMECSGKSVSFAGARMPNANFFACTFPDLDCRGAFAKSVRFVHNSALPRAQFAGTNLTEANFRNCVLDEADFSGARMLRADLSLCSLVNAKFVRSVARQARFVRANLTQADMTCADLMDAVLDKARLNGTRLNTANLFRATMARLKSDEKLSMAGANVKKLRILPKARKS